MSYRINEIFYSLQGEGTYTGTPAVFIRFAGCNLKCHFCDTDWTKGYAMTAAEIVECTQMYTKAYSPELVVLTGGEPTLQVDSELLDRLHTKFQTIAIETNGTHEVPAGVNFVTLSPKEDFTSNAKVILESASEVKVVFDGVHNPERWHDKIVAYYYYLQPCDTGSEAKNREIIEKCVRYIKAHPWWKLSLQTQKILNIK